MTRRYKYTSFSFKSPDYVLDRLERSETRERVRLTLATYSIDHIFWCEPLRSCTVRRRHGHDSASNISRATQTRTRASSRRPDILHSVRALRVRGTCVGGARALRGKDARFDRSVTQSFKERPYTASFPSPVTFTSSIANQTRYRLAD